MSGLRRDRRGGDAPGPRHTGSFTTDAIDAAAREASLPARR